MTAHVRRRQVPVGTQIARTAELDRIRLQRSLTADERAEADDLAHRAYMRAWRRTPAGEFSQLRAASR